MGPCRVRCYRNDRAGYRRSTSRRGVLGSEVFNDVQSNPLGWSCLPGSIICHISPRTDDHTIQSKEQYQLMTHVERADTLIHAANHTPPLLRSAWSRVPHLWLGDHRVSVVVSVFPPPFPESCMLSKPTDRGQTWIIGR